MAKPLVLNHISVECIDEHSSDIFFMKIIGMQKIKSTTLSKELSQKIFRIDAPIQFLMYEMGALRIEAFIRNTNRQLVYNHVGIEVENRHDFITQCTRYGLAPFFVDKDGKQLLFVRDFSENLFEISGKH